MGKEAVFPAAAHLSVACEALRQVFETRGLEIQSVTFRDVLIKAALAIPDDDDGIETQFRLNELDDGKWFSFSVESFSQDQWNQHSEGKIAANYITEAPSSESGNPVDTMKLTQRVPGKRWYDAFNRVGFEYGPSFQPLSNIRTNSKYHHAAADVQVKTESDLMVGESRYILHPSTIDGCLQLIIISINSGLHKEMQYGVVPIKIEELSMWHPSQKAKTAGKAVAWTDELDGRYFNTHTKLTTETGEMVLDVKGLRCVSYEAAVPQTNTPSRDREPYMETVWRPDITGLTTEQAVQAYPSIQSEEDSIAAVVELMQHKKHVASATVLAQVDDKTLKAVSKKVSASTKLTVADVSNEHLERVTDGVNDPNVVTIVSKEGLFDWGEEKLDSQDLAIVGTRFAEHATEQQLFDGLANLISKGAKAIFSVPSAKGQAFAEKIQQGGFSDPELFFPLPDVTIISATFVGSYQNGHVEPQHRVTIFTLNEQFESSCTSLAESLQDQGCVIDVCDIWDLATFSPDKDATYIINDTAGTFITSLTEKTFDILKSILTSGTPTIWLTSGVNEGINITGGMSQGFLRAIRSEQASAKVLLIDVNLEESPEAIGKAVFDKLGHISTKDSGADTEYWLQNGVLNIARVLPNEPLNTQFSANLAPAEQTSLPESRALSGKFVDGKLVFQSQNLDQLTPDGVELQVQYASLERTDLQAHASGLAIVAGPITTVGSGLDGSFVGGKAVAYAPNSFDTVLRAPISLGASYSDVEESELLATLPSLAKATNTVLDVAKVQANEHVLLLPAPTPFVKAVNELKRAHSFRLSVIAATNEEKEALVRESGVSSSEVLLAPEIGPIRSILEGSESDRPNVVISHDFTALGRDVWRYMPAASRFILNDSAIEGGPDTLPFLRGVSFLPSGISNLYKRQPAALGDLLRRTIAFMAEHKISWNASVHDVSELNDLATFTRNEQSGQNLVLKYDHGHSSIMVRPRFIVLLKTWLIFALAPTLRHVSTVLRRSCILPGRMSWRLGPKSHDLHDGAWSPGFRFPLPLRSR